MIDTGPKFFNDYPQTTAAFNALRNGVENAHRRIDQIERLEVGRINFMHTDNINLESVPTSQLLAEIRRRMNDQD